MGYVWLSVTCLVLLAVISKVRSTEHISTDSDDHREILVRYVFSFLSNAFDEETHGQVVIAATTNKPTSGILWLPYLDIHKNFTGLEFGNSIVIDLPSTANPIKTGEQPSTVVIKADAEIAVYGIHFRPFHLTQDSFVVVPKKALGSEYYVASYSPLQSWSPVFTITAIENGTNVRIIFSNPFSYNGTTYNKATPLVLNLNQFQTYQFETRFDPTGTYISANKPISVSSGSECSYVPLEFGTCDNLLENLIPVTSWGRKFSLAPFRGRLSGYIIRIISAYRDTSVRISTNTTHFQLNNGDFLETDVTITGVLEISSNNPILVLQYNKGNEVNPNDKGDPSMTIVPSHEQSLRGTIGFPVYEIESSHVTVRLTNGDHRALLLDDETIDWTLIGIDSFGGKIVQADVTLGYHILSHVYAKAEMSVLVYGNEYQTTYASPAVYKFQRRPVVGASCQVWGDPHYITFDGRTYSFQGDCEYTLVKTCGNIGLLYPFEIVSDNFKFRPSHLFSLLGSLKLLVFGKEYELLLNNEVRVNGVTKTLPYADRFGISIYYSLPHRILMTDFGLTIRIDDHYNAEIDIPATYTGYVCGLCGTYDGDASNDFVSPQGNAVSSTENFATSWAVNNRETCEVYIPMGPCDDGGGSPNIPQARVSCGIIRNRRGPFSNCVDIVDWQAYYDSCVYDLCAMSPDKSILCSHLEQYAQACRDAGGQPGNWRANRPVQCTFECPADMVYTSCGTGCPATCVQLVPREDCPMTCLETCQCPSGKVLDGTNCVYPSDCGCPLPDGGYASEGTEVMFEDCTLTCFCRNGDLECTEVLCDDNAECAIKSGERNCYCNEGFQGNGTHCTQSSKTCQIFGDPHYKTFDNAMYSLSGSCSYVLTKICHDRRGLPNFNIIGTNEVTVYGIPSTNLLSIRLKIFGKNFFLDNSGEAYADGLLIESFPYIYEDEIIIISYSYPSLMIMTNFGLYIKYNFLGNGSASIEVPPRYFGKLCGLCGDADGDTNNEYQLQNGDMVSSSYEFSDDWYVGYCPPGAPIPHHYLENPDSAAAHDTCYFLISESGPLAPCYDFLDPTPYYDACIFDVFAIYPHREFMCDIAMHYVEACRQAGGRPLNWRARIPDCNMRCPENTTYGSCNSGCPKTCANPEGLYYCPVDCIETCQCPPGYVLEYDRCVRLSQCRCPDPSGGMVQPGNVQVNADCTVKCKCIDGEFVCSSITCDVNAVCDLRGSFKDCYCNDGYQGDGQECHADGSESRCDPPWYTPRGVSCYGYHDILKSFEDGEAACMRKNGHLVSIGDKTENAFITRLAHGRRAWIGGLRDTSLDIPWRRTDPSYTFQYLSDILPEGIHRIEFSVRAKKNAHIALSPYQSDSPFMYEIVIGGWSNTKTAIRRCKGCATEVDVLTRNILKREEDIRFYITFHLGHIEVGIFGNDPFLTWTDPDPIDVHYVGYTTALNSGRWKFYNDFVWLNGDPWVFDSWRRGEPSNHNGYEGCIETNYVTEGLWNDHQCSARKTYVCEVPIRPIT